MLLVIHIAGLQKAVAGSDAVILAQVLAKIYNFKLVAVVNHAWLRVAAREAKLGR